MFNDKIIEASEDLQASLDRIVQNNGFELMDTLRVLQIVTDNFTKIVAESRLNKHSDT